MAGSAPTNSAAVDFEKQQAAEADQKEAQRQADLAQGVSAINAIYDPQPVMKTTQTPFDWSTFQAPAATSAAMNPAWAGAPKPTGIPAGYTAVQIPGASAAGTAATDASGRPTLLKGTPNTANALPMNSNNTLSGYNPGAGATGGAASAPTWGLEDASGKIYKQGDPLSVSSQTPTGQTTGGFGDDYYNAYNQKILDYYNPDEQRQYNEAQRNLQYSLARAGTLQSSTAADKTGELAYQDAINKAQIVSNANDQTGQLRDTINSDKQSLINQLYTTDDPTLTANLAQSSANAAQLKDPTLTPMAGLFNTGLTTVGSALSPLTSPYSTVPAGYGGAGAAASPTPAAASASSGKTYS